MRLGKKCSSQFGLFYIQLDLSGDCQSGEIYILNISTLKTMFYLRRGAVRVFCTHRSPRLFLFSSVSLTRHAYFTGSDAILKMVFVYLRKD